MARAWTWGRDSDCYPHVTRQTELRGKSKSNRQGQSTPDEVMTNREMYETDV